jgi:hypothetical protein
LERLITRGIIPHHHGAESKLGHIARYASQTFQHDFSGFIDRIDARNSFSRRRGDFALDLKS